MAEVGWATLKQRSIWPLVLGDAVSFLVFSALGHRSHEESGSLAAVIGTAAPFVIGWLAVAPWTGAYAPATRSIGDLLRRTSLSWLLAWPVCLVLRALVLRRGIPWSFALVALLANAVFLLGWRAVYAFLQRGRRNSS